MRKAKQQHKKKRGKKSEKGEERMITFPQLSSMTIADDIANERINAEPDLTFLFYFYFSVFI